MPTCSCPKSIIDSESRDNQMTTKQLIQNHLDRLSDANLEVMYQIIKRFVQLPRTHQPLQSLPRLEAVKVDSTPPKKRRSILELRGLGKSLWQAVSVSDYLQVERDSWHG
jgi:hypothetical protein